MLHATVWRRLLLAFTLLPCLVASVVLHFGFAHYRDVTQAVQQSLEEGGGSAGTVSEQEDGSGHPLITLRQEEAALGEFKAQFLWWLTDEHFEHPASRPPDDHSEDGYRAVPNGNVGYRADGGVLYEVIDPRAGNIDGWRSQLLLIVGFIALVLSAWKWYGGREPIPDFVRLHERKQGTARVFETGVKQAFEAVNREEQSHLHRLGEAETEAAALSGRLTAIQHLRQQIVVRELDHLQQVWAAVATAVEGFREENRQRRLSQDPPPAFWAHPWRPPASPEREHAAAEWDREHEMGLDELAELAERIRADNQDHIPDSAAAFEFVRERLAQSAGRRPSGTRARGSGAQHGGNEVLLLPRISRGRDRRHAEAES